MNDLILQLTLLQAVLPLAVIVLNALVTPASLITLLLRVTAISLTILYLALCAVWLFPPFWTPWLLAILHIAGSVYAYQKLKKRTDTARRWRKLGESVLGIIAIVILGIVLLPLLDKRNAPQEMLALTTPLANGTYLVTSGGRSHTINSHIKTMTGKRFEKWRGQSYAVDLIEINSLGMRANSVSPEDPAVYFIYGKPVLAPCNGTVRRREDGHRDMPVPEMDRDYMLGNHVFIECQQHFVLLAHLAEGSVAVENGDTVQAGTMIGRVGNSGNTAEPHLHIHVQKTLPSQDPVSAQPAWFTLEGQFLRRNDVFQVF